jgi:hypothetical protein
LLCLGFFSNRNCLCVSLNLCCEFVNGSVKEGREAAKIVETKL